MTEPNTGWPGDCCSYCSEQLEQRCGELYEENQQLRLRVAYLEDELISQPPSLSKLAWTWWRERRAKRQAS